jgi:hypothetical protein
MKPTLLLAAAAGLATCWPGAGAAKAAGLDFWLVVNKGEVQVLSAPVGAPESEKGVVLQVNCQSCNFSAGKTGGIAAAFRGNVAVRCRPAKGNEFLLTADRLVIGSDPSHGVSLMIEGSDGNPARLLSGPASGLPPCTLAARRIELWPTSGRVDAAGTIRLDLAPAPAAAEPGPEDDPLPSAPSASDPLPPDSRPDPRR